MASSIQHSEPAEIRSDGRTLTGLGLPFGVVSQSHSERFEPGSIVLDSRTRWLDWGHNVEKIVAHTGEGGGLTLRTNDEGVHVTARLPELPLSEIALQAVKSGKITGLSAEFRVLVERKENSGVRVVQRAQLLGFGLVENPSYPTSIEARASGGLRGTVPYARRLYCECQDGRDCNDAQFEPGCFEKYINGDQEGAEILATASGFDESFASLSRGSIRLSDDPEGLRVTIAKSALETATGKRILELMEAVPIRCRPLIDRTASPPAKKTVDGVETAVYSVVSLRGFLFRPVTGPRASEWPEVELLDKAPEKRVVQPRRARFWL